MAKLQIYSAKGTKTGTMDLPKEYAADSNQDLLTQALFVLEDRSHKGTARVKTRGEVHGTTAKMYRQKGTGNARHGDRKAPIFKGGGNAHGPHGVKRVLTISQRMGKKALNVALGLKLKEGRLVVADKLDSITKTKEAQTLLTLINKDLGIKGAKSMLIALSGMAKDKVKYFRNIEGVRVSDWHNLNSHDVYLSSFVMVEKDAFTEKKSVGQRTSKVTKETLKTEIKSPSSKITKKVLPNKVQKKVANKKTVKPGKKSTVKTSVKKGNKK